MLKIAVLAPMARASMSTAVAVKPGLLRSWRNANLPSDQRVCIFLIPYSYYHSGQPARRQHASPSDLGGQYLPEPLHAGVAAGEDHPHATAAEDLVREDAGEAGGSGRLDDDLEMAEDRHHDGEDLRVVDGEHAGRELVDQAQ